MNFRHKSAARDYALILLGACIMGFAIKNIYDPIGLVTGGAAGVAIIVKEKFGINLWITNTAVNIPLFFGGDPSERLAVYQADTDCNCGSFHFSVSDSGNSISYG